MSFRPNLSERYLRPDGRLTLDGIKLFQSMFDRIGVLEGKLTAIAAVTDPTGGATVDAEARTAIQAIIDEAG